VGVKSRNKVSAEFSMSSLTDIIFLLLIFFMLTSKMVQINLDLPEADAKTVASTALTVMIDRNLNYSINGKPTTVGQLERELRREVAAMEEQERATITIAAEKGVAWENIARLMSIASDLNAKAILATQPRKVN
jgi:biopolymer transport protein ExbD